MDSYWFFTGREHLLKPKARNFREGIHRIAAMVKPTSATVVCWSAYVSCSGRSLWWYCHVALKSPKNARSATRTAMPTGNASLYGVGSVIVMRV